MIFISTFFILFPVYTRFFSTLVLLWGCYWDWKCLSNFKHIFYSDRCVFQGGEPSKRPKGFPHDWFAAALLSEAPDLCQSQDMNMHQNERIVCESQSTETLYKNMEFDDILNLDHTWLK